MPGNLIPNKLYWFWGFYYVMYWIKYFSLCTLIFIIEMGILLFEGILKYFFYGITANKFYILRYTKSEYENYLLLLDIATTYFDLKPYIVQNYLFCFWTFLYVDVREEINSIYHSSGNQWELNITFQFKGQVNVIDKY